MLELHPKWFSRDGLTYGENRRAFMYDVLGLPEGQKIEIGENRCKWQIRRATNGEPYREWSGKKFSSAQEAFASLS
jgi:hypothetical protein